MPEPAREKEDGDAYEDRLIGFECGQAADPCAGNAETDEHQRKEATRRSKQRADNAAGRQPALAPIRVSVVFTLVHRYFRHWDCHAPNAFDFAQIPV